MQIDRMLFSLVLLCAVVSVPAYSQTGDKLDEAITKAVTQYDSAWNKKDAAAVSGMLTNDYVYFSSTGGLTDRKATLDFLASPDYKLTFVERSEIKLLSRNDLVA